MDKYVIKLLFDPRGKINNHEFKLGIILLFVLVIWFQFFTGIQILSQAFFSNKHGVVMMAQREALSFFTVPQLPVFFVLFYFSIVISIKRFRELSKKDWLGAILGLGLFMFFHSISASYNTLFAITGNLGLDISNIQKWFNGTSIVSALIIGTIIMIFLSLTKKSSILFDKNSYSTDLSIQDFILKIGTLVVAFGVITLTILFFSILYPKWEIITSISILSFVIFLVLYLRLVFKRMKNAGISKNVFWITQFTFAVTISIYLFSIYNASNLITYQISNFCISIVILVFELANVLLYILPTRQIIKPGNEF